ncbi:DNA mismatch repair protein [Stieleria sp. JC731]|uniref:MutS-related protein n=1 Tax=Pirellulaceae TaxID=2691357 RepID=UPI001E4D8B9D|nr:DNA mismatch repair protein [Stieleria sp. JC731]MCC9599257.1 DNA mismatch repair protein [Stieleria sp. JC731]
MESTETAAGKAAPTQSARQFYEQKLADAEAHLVALRQKDSKFSTARVLLFTVSLAMILLGSFSDVGMVVMWIGWGLFALFFVVAVLNEPVRDGIAAKERDCEVLRRLIARLDRNWDELNWKATRKRLQTVELEEHQKDVADDLDLLGKTSLFQLVSMAGTTVGVRTLASWLTSTANASTAKLRSQAIKRLTPKREERLRFYSLATDVGQGTGDPDEFIRWSQSDAWLGKHRWMVPWSNSSSVASVVLIVALASFQLGVVDAYTAKMLLAALVAIVVINVLISTVMLGPVHQIFSIAMSSRQSVDEYRELFAAANWLVDDSSADARLEHLHHVLLDAPENSAKQGMRDLGWIAWLGSLRTSAGTFLLYLPLQIFGLWDVRVFAKLESWQKKYRENVPEWFNAFGEVEALMSLAAVCDENPDWVFPKWNDGESLSNEDQCFRSVGLGHPLLPNDARVCNDVTIGPPGKVLLVTGSNMSGKSTMLRSAGLNIALAGTGCSVCAKELSLPSIELSTSIRVRDNLAEGVSFYMAELKRLKGVVDRARHLADDKGIVSMFLLDEILQGTNSRERQIAVTQVLRHLIECQAIGAISTHDLELADEPELIAVSEIVHFRETITPDAQGNEQMTFDYQMHSGVSPTTNALRLLEIVGLGKAE